MQVIISEEELKQLEQIGFISADQLNTLLEDASDGDIEAVHTELKTRGVVITETAPPNLPRHPNNAEADPHVINEVEELNG